MSLVRKPAPAQIRTTDLGGAVKLDDEPAVICSPTPEQQNRFGGIIRHRVLLGPQADIVPGDFFFILSWRGHSVDSSKRYYVHEAELSGSGDLAKMNVLVSERALR